MLWNDSAKTKLVQHHLVADSSSSHDSSGRNSSLSFFLLQIVISTYFLRGRQ